MKRKARNGAMKAPAIFFVVLGLLLAGFPPPVYAQDENPATAEQTEAESTVPAVEKPATPAPAATEQAEVSTPTTTAAVSLTPATEPPPVATPAPAPVSEEEPAATSAAPSAETPQPADIAAPAAAEETEPVAQAEAPASAVEKPAMPVPAATEQAEVSTQATTAAVSLTPATEPPPVATPAPAPVSEEKPAAASAAPSAETPPPADIAAPEAAAEKPVTPAAVVAEKPSATAPASVPEKPAEEKPSAEKDLDFDLDRGSVNATPDEKSAAAEKAEARPQPKTSFWSRLFGREKDAPSATEITEKTESATVDALEKTSAPIAGQTATPSAAIADMAVTNQMLTQEELVAAQEEVRRQAKEVEALKALDLAYQAMGRNDFEAALKSFNQAMNAMPVRPHTVETRQKARQSQAECEYRIALNYYRDGKYQEAKDAIRRVLGYYPAHQKAIRLSEQIKKDEAQRVKRVALPVPPRHAAEHLDSVKLIRESIDRGRQYYAIGEYENARREFNNVLVIDEKNDEAAAQLKKLYAKMYNLETDQMNRQQADMIAQVRDTWTPPVKRETAGPKAGIQDTTITDKSKRRLLEKLNGIMIPQLEFRQANIVDVIKYLDQVSIVNDKDSAPGEKGVNFILQLRRPGDAAETAPIAAAKPAEGELVGEEMASGPPANLPTVTLSLRNIILMDAIKYITEVTGLKYRIEENVVVITPSDVVYGQLITRTYKVQPSIAETIMGAAGSTGGGGEMMELGGAAPTVERGDVKKFFVEYGVPFPEGTSIVYKPSLNLLIVKNTADNFENFERILTSLNVVPVQVEIEARFVEVAQDDLEELGVEWLLTDNWELAENAGAGAAIPLASRERIQMNQNTMSKGLRNLAQTAGGIAATPGGNLAGILSISSILTNPEMTMILHALEQKSGANLLSAPKVTTKSGANAEIKVVEELIYPTEFEVQSPIIPSGGIGQQIYQPALVTPAAFQTRDTGVILNVTPTVGPDGFSIDLVMLPQVVELASWINYGSTLVNPISGQAEIMNMPQPIFKSRNITTSITIWDGQTVVMGGMISEKQTTTLDKIPILGDIPLLGFLFQSKTSNSKKYNLLIFVTANLVDPAGNKINKELIATAAGTGNVPASPAAP